MLNAAACLDHRNPSDYEGVLRRKGRTFYWASRLFGKRLACDVAVLYGFCRYLDDLADECSGTDGRHRLAAIERDVATGRSAVPVVRDFLSLASRVQLPLASVQALISTLRDDTDTVRFRDWAQTVRYGYGAAGTVGQIFCALVGVRERQALFFAVDLGIAMQLTNIARDLLEDAERGRLYLPVEVDPGLDRVRAIREDDGSARKRALGTVGEVLDIAGRYYRSADAGMRYLPWRARAAVMVASRCYEAIGGVIRRRGDRYWEGRCYVGTGAKLWHSFRAICALVLNPRYWGWVPGRAHDASLHLPLADLPGTDRCT